MKTIDSLGVSGRRQTRDGGMRAPKATRGQAPSPTRPLAQRHHYGVGAQAADTMLGARPIPKEVHLGQAVQYGSPAHSPKHPGFRSVQATIAKKEGVSKDRAGAILAAASRGASKSAKKANPRLGRVKG